MPLDEATRRQRQALHCGFACVALFGGGTAVAQEQRAYAVGFDQTFKHDSNIFRVQEGQPTTSDTSSSTGVLGEVVLPLGRQRFYANGNLHENRYRRNGALDNTSYGLDVGVNWATAERLSGTVNYALTESLAPFGIDGRTRVSQKNELKTRQLNAIARLGLVTRLSAEASAQHRRVDYSAAEYAPLNYEQDQGAAGLRFSVDPSLTLGIGIRHAKGHYPQFRLIGPGAYAVDRYKRDDIDLTGTWQPTAKSNFVGRLSYGRQNHREATQRNFKSATGSLSWAYQPTGKLGLTTTLIRDTGAETRFGDSVSTAAMLSGNDVSRLSTGLQLAVRYDITAKFQLNGAVNGTRRSLVSIPASGNGAPAGSTSGNDRTRAATLGLRYTLNRNWVLDCTVGRETRSTDTALSYAYRANTVSCAAQFLVY